MVKQSSRRAAQALGRVGGARSEGFELKRMQSLSKNEMGKVNDSALRLRC